MKTAVILAGGLGTRLGMSGTPKAMLGIDGKTLIQHQLDWLAEIGYETVILCLGYKGELVTYSPPPLIKKIIRSIEEEPLGTAGAIRLAYDNYDEFFEEGVLIVNVDDLCFHPLIEKSKLPLNIPAIITKKIPYSVWIEGTIFSQNEARQHIGHTWIPVNYLSKLPEKESLEKCLAMWSKEGKVASIDTEDEWYTMNSKKQWMEAKQKWKEDHTGANSV